jgi:hypothetical protein
MSIAGTAAGPRHSGWREIVVKRPAEVIGTTAVSLFVTAPFLAALWLTIWRPQYEWLSTILPLVIVLGAPVALVVTGAAGPKLGRRVSEVITRGKGDKHSKTAEASPSSLTSLRTDPPAPVKKSVTITPPAASMEAGTSAPSVSVLLVSASDALKIQVQETLFATCSVAVASTSAQAVMHILREPPRQVIFDPSANIWDVAAIVKAAREATKLKLTYWILQRAGEQAAEVQRFQREFQRLQREHQSLWDEMKLVDLDHLKAEVLSRVKV